MSWQESIELDLIHFNKLGDLVNQNESSFLKVERVWKLQGVFFLKVGRVGKKCINLVRGDKKRNLIVKSPKDTTDIKLVNYSE